ncbi:MAG: hypothetical protein KKA67_05325 [Spirochaetes bacterium]|nr:hypothetical protein [Spirochaetota bacterium]MBU1081960.1 hypothetical protein [Spirochaetota bacterium]
MDEFEEFPGVRQRPDEGFRRFFSTRYFDLMVWYSENGGILTGFQLCYDKRGEERAVTFKLDEGAEVRSHRFVATGRSSDRSNAMTSILSGDAGSLPADVAEKFSAASASLQPEIVAFIGGVLRRFAAEAEAPI